MLLSGREVISSLVTNFFKLFYLYTIYLHTLLLKMDHNDNIDFKELKKELKDVEKLTKENLDIKTWESDIKLWIELEEVENPKKIFMACLLTSRDEPRKIIQELEDSDDDDDTDEEDNEDEGEEDDNEENHQYPSLEKIVDALESFYGLKEDQNLLLREIRSLRIRRNEKVKDFNRRYKSLYLKLDKKRKKQVCTLDYAESLQNNKEAWKRVSLKDDISLKKAFKVAEKVDRLITRLDNEPTTSRGNSPAKSFQRNTNQLVNSSKKKVDTYIPKKITEDDDIVDITNRMRKLTIKACFFCREKGHYQNRCPKLQAIIEENKKQLQNESLNH